MATDTAKSNPFSNRGVNIDFTKEQVKESLSAPRSRVFPIGYIKVISLDDGIVPFIHIIPTEVIDIPQ